MAEETKKNENDKQDKKVIIVKGYEFFGKELILQTGTIYKIIIKSEDFMFSS